VPNPPEADAPIVVVGAGVAGLGTALALARAGHRVTLFERDATPLPADPDAAFAWDRRGAPQVRHSHALLARLRNLLRDRYPDVLDELLAAGATEIRFADSLPVEIEDRDPRPGDDDLVALACRRTTFEWVLRRKVLATDAVTLRDGVIVDRLMADSTPSGPRVTGVRVRAVDAAAADETSTEEVPASMVVAALGRRSAVPAWLDELDVHPDEQVEDTGIIYLSRFYRLHDEAEPPATDGPIGGDLGYLKYAVFQGDNRTLSVTFAVDSDDRELRTRLVEATDFDQAARSLPATRPWADAAVTEAITEVHTMGGLINRKVAYVDADGRPLVLGFHAVGDAHTCTNPLYGRGCSLAMVQANLLTDALAEHPGAQPDDLVARSVAYEAASDREIRPWYRASVNQDRLNRQAAADRAAARDHESDGVGVGGTSDRSSDDAPGREDDADRTTREFVQSIMRDGLLPAVRTDATVFRAFVRAFNLLDPPELITTDPDVVNRVLAAYQSRDERPPDGPLGPDRDELLAALDGR
jgi:2-polyprenyl-6-methoxyphenol hydroxylase-like FAD-dependent oxidoreductase